MRPCTRRIVPAEEVIKATSLNDVLVEHAPWCMTAPKRTPNTQASGGSIVERRAVIFAPYLGQSYRGHGCGT